VFHLNHAQAVFALGFLVFVGPVSTSIGWADQLDPTKISKQIESLLSGRALPDDSQTTEATPVAERPAPFRLQLRGIVLRDQDHGTAIISDNDSPTCMVTLRRDLHGVSAQQVRLDGRTLVVADFSERSVMLRTEDHSFSILVQ
jgi:hypothetical protein